MHHQTEMMGGTHPTDRARPSAGRFAGSPRPEGSGWGPGSGGWIEVICGGMSSGKSEELIRRIKRAAIARLPVQVFKPVLDTRWNRREVVSRNGASLDAIEVLSAEEIIPSVASVTRVVAVDEAQFFDSSLPDVCQALASEGIRVIVAGLDQDFRGEPFGPMPKLLAIAEIVDKLRAICVACGGPASRTQRIVDGRPASFHEPTILLGSSDRYEARCRRCHEVRDLPVRGKGEPAGQLLFVEPVTP